MEYIHYSDYSDYSDFDFFNFGNPRGKIDIQIHLRVFFSICVKRQDFSVLIAIILSISFSIF